MTTRWKPVQAHFWFYFLFPRWKHLCRSRDPRSSPLLIPRPLRAQPGQLCEGTWVSASPRGSSGASRRQQGPGCCRGLAWGRLGGFVWAGGRAVTRGSAGPGRPWGWQTPLRCLQRLPPDLLRPFPSRLGVPAASRAKRDTASSRGAEPGKPPALGPPSPPPPRGNGWHRGRSGVAASPQAPGGLALPLSLPRPGPPPPQPPTESGGLRQRLPPSCATRKPRRPRVTRPPGEGGAAAAGTGAGGGGESPQRRSGTRQPEGARLPVALLSVCLCVSLGGGRLRRPAGPVAPAAGPGAAGGGQPLAVGARVATVSSVQGRDYISQRAPRRGGQLSRELAGPAPRLHFPQAFSAPEVGARHFRGGVRPREGGGARRRGSGGGGGRPSRWRQGWTWPGLRPTGAAPTFGRSSSVRCECGPRSQRWVGRRRASASARGASAAPAVPRAVRARVVVSHRSPLLCESFLVLLLLPGFLRGPRCLLSPGPFRRPPVRGPRYRDLLRPYVGGRRACSLTSFLRSFFPFTFLFPRNTGFLSRLTASALGLRFWQWP